MKKLLLTTALASATAFGAHAQDNAATTDMTAAETKAANTGAFRLEVDPLELHASDFIGMRVYAEEADNDVAEVNGIQDNWEDIGEINDVVLSREGKVDAVIVDVGGFLGMGERRVAVNMDAIDFVSDTATADDANDYFLVMTAARADVESAPEYKYEAKMAAAEASAEANAEAAEANAEAAAADAAAATDTAAAETAAAADQAEDEMDAAVVTDTEAATGEAQTDAAKAADATPMQGWVEAKFDEMSAEELKGAAVYDSTEQRVGEVGEVLLTDAGKVNEAVIDVGGFLGIGEKPVAMKFQDLKIMRADGGTEIRVYVPSTKEELEAMPKYDAS